MKAFKKAAVPLALLMLAACLPRPAGANSPGAPDAGLAAGQHLQYVAQNYSAQPGPSAVRQLSLNGNDEVSVILDGRRIIFAVPPTIINGRTMVPMRAIFEAMGAQIHWDDASRTVHAQLGGNRLVLPIGSTSPRLNGVVIPIDQPAVIIDNRTMVPLRFIAESSGATVTWDEANRTAIITTRWQQPPPQQQTPAPQPQAPPQQPPAQQPPPHHQQPQQPVIPELIWSRNDPLPEYAPWDQPRYRNNSLPSQRGISAGSIITNSVLMQEIQAFNDRYASRLNNPPPEMFLHSFGFSHPPLTDNDVSTKNMFINIFCRAWDNDTLSQVMPFNSAYIRDVLNGVDMYFAGHSVGISVRGHYYREPARGVNQMFIISNHSSSPMASLPTYPHEVGRALGLNSSLTVLFSSKYQGIYEPLSNRWAIDYAPHFDYALHNTVGGELFWRAAFTSNSEYTELWNRHMPVSMQDVERVRMLAFLILEGDTSLLHRYHMAGGTLSINDFSDLPVRFAVALDPWMPHYLTPQQYQSALRHFGDRTQMIRSIIETAAIAEQLGVVNTYRHVDDLIIQNTPVATAQRESLIN